MIMVQVVVAMNVIPEKKKILGIKFRGSVTKALEMGIVQAVAVGVVTHIVKSE
jgi:hypothetical protein